MQFRSTGAAPGALLICLIISCTMGKTPSVKKEYLQVFYKDGVTEPTAQKLLAFLHPLWRNEGDSTQPKSVELTKTADTINFRMVIAPERVSEFGAENLGSFIQLLSDTVFDAAPVNLVLCDDHFKEQKMVRYSAGFRKGAETRETTNKALFGNRYRVGTAEVYVQPGVDEAFGEKLAKYLDESNGSGEVHASFQVLKDGSAYIVKMVTSPEFADQNPDSAFTNMANSLSRDIFGGSPVTFVLADAMFKNMKQFPSNAE